MHARWRRRSAPRPLSSSRASTTCAGTPGQDYNVGCDNEVNGVTVARKVLLALGRLESLMSFVQHRPRRTDTPPALAPVW